MKNIVSAGHAFTLDTKGGRLFRDMEEPIPLSGKQWSLLCLFAEHPGKLFSNDELLDRIWADAAVTPQAVGQVVRGLRRALGDDTKDPYLIETVYARGFRFNAEVTDHGGIVSGDLFSDEAAVAANPTAADLLLARQIEQNARDSHRAELLLFAPHINDFLSILGEFRDIAEIMIRDPSSETAAAMLQDRIDDFKGFNVNSTNDLLVEMQKYFGYFMNVVSLLFDGLQMLANERVYGFNGERDPTPDRGQRVFANEGEFATYLRTEITVGVDLLSNVIVFVQNSLRERPDVMLLRPASEESVQTMIQWSRKIAKDSRGDEHLFERI